MRVCVFDACECLCRDGPKQRMAEMLFKIMNFKIDFLKISKPCKHSAKRSKTVVGIFTRL